MWEHNIRNNKNQETYKSLAIAECVLRNYSTNTIKYRLKQIINKRKSNIKKQYKCQKIKTICSIINH